jgi:trehalose 6-phosphate phosphatase
MAEMLALLEQIVAEMRHGRKYWLFLDYDGTLAEFAPTPDQIIFDSQLNDLMARLVKHASCLRVVVLSGRTLEQIARLLPIRGILLAGTYGVEYQDWSGARFQALDYQASRPLLEQVKRAWIEIIADSPGYFIEDKAAALALHARHAEPIGSVEILRRAKEAAEAITAGATLQVSTGFLFLETAPGLAQKGQAVTLLLKRHPCPGCGCVYVGDDEKDEDAFRVINQLGGITIVVTRQGRSSRARYRLGDPTQVRRWLSALVDALDSSLPLSCSGT